MIFQALNGWLVNEPVGRFLLVPPYTYMHECMYIFMYIQTQACIRLQSPNNTDKIQWQLFLKLKNLTVVSELEAAILLAANHMHVSIQIHTYICTFLHNNFVYGKIWYCAHGSFSRTSKISLLTWGNSVSMYFLTSEYCIPCMNIC